MIAFKEKIKKNALISLLLLPLFFLLHNYNEVFGFIPLSQLLLFGTVFYLLLFATYLVIKKWLRSGTKSALLLFVLSFFFLLFGPLHQFALQLSKGSLFGSYSFLLPLISVLVLFLIVRIIRNKIIWPGIISYLNVLMICLLLVETISLFRNIMLLKKDHNLIYPYKTLSDAYRPNRKPDSTKPDIYFLVFDEYTNNQTLEKVWHFDNRKFTDWLDSMGFYNPRQTRANYTFTPYSISSTFNLNYIRDKRKSIDAMVPLNILQGVKSMSDNECFAILKKENYHIRFIAPFRNSIEDPGLGHVFQNLANEQLYRQTLWGSMDADIFWRFRVGSNPLIDDSKRNMQWLKDKFNYNLATINQIMHTVDSNSNRQPQFIYAHFLVTHGPHIYDEDGRFDEATIQKNLPTPKTYITQIRYANKILREMVGRIRSGNKPNSIIIIEGDHGFRQFPGRDTAMYFPNFLSVYFPDRNYSGMNDEITPLNVFRLVFNRYFDQQYPLLKDSSILVKDSEN